MNVQSSMEEREWAGRKLTVYLPPTYAVSERSYKTVYVHDGGKLMGACFRYMERLFCEEKVEEVIVIGVHSACRNDEYTPWPTDAVTEGRPVFGGAGRAYLDELADSIKPWIDSVYRTKPEPAHTGLIGGSLGGLISLFAAYFRPDAFGRFGLLSASLWYEGALAQLVQWPVPPKEQTFYVSVGNREGQGKVNRQREMVPNTLALCRDWRARGIAPLSLKLEIVDGATHDFIFMAKQFPEALAWLYPPKEQYVQDSFGKSSANVRKALLGLVPAEDAAIVPYAVPGTEQLDLVSGITGLPYRIFIHMPLKPAPPEGYPVLYAVDGNAYFGSLAEAMRLVTRHPRGLPPGVIVGIGYPSEGPFVAERRFYDLTTLAKRDGLRPDGSVWPVNGGAELFLDFIEQELIPLIGQRLPIDYSRQSLFGHSLGGYFTLHTLMTRPTLFRSYIAGSPSLWWDDRLLFRRLPEWEQREGSRERAPELMIMVGTKDDKIYESARDYYRALLPYRDQAFSRLEWSEFAGEGHVSVLHPLISPMLRFLFAHPGEELRI
ncbi:alpha/beta hydrolase [Paenibacillus sanguinis]|uniref:alpha/beta hydrolase n=1 Tax=Paenibacillus sanguinis TaxID=225906 RepID=UPI0003A1C0CE|nr:alpha/beta hydrolase-fold protein [Paenibacillus sanguinis]